MTRPAARARSVTSVLALRWRRLGAFTQRRILPSDRFLLLVLALTTVAAMALSVLSPTWVPLSAVSLAILAGGYLLTLRSLLLLYAIAAAVLPFAAAYRAQGSPPVPSGLYVVIIATALIVLVFARSRSRLGVQGTRGESMLVDLRDRLRAQGELPELPPQWQTDVVLRSAGGAQFSGDFVVASQSADGRMLEIALVDVSGKGVGAGTRALMLSGALGGLLGAMPRQDFLPAANQYLLRQRWHEGFATAAHLALDLDSGEFVVAVGGHPPPAQFDAGSGRWLVLEQTTGPLLGVLEDATFASQCGRLNRGDALLLYTDGLIETPGRDLSLGIDRLLGEAERLVTAGFRHGADRLVDAIADGGSDDRALVLIWRE